MKKVPLFIFLLLLCLQSTTILARTIVWYDGNQAVAYSVETRVEPVVDIAIDMFTGDMKAVTGRKAEQAKSSRAVIRVFQLDKSSSSQQKWLKNNGVDIDVLHSKIDGFNLSVIDNAIIICGANGRGTAYGILELSRMAGVSPWIWWGDAVPKHKERLTIDSSYSTLQGASVEYRGIFINDEDWSLRPWSCNNYEPAESGGQIGTKTYKRIFQLLLRLRANALWPAMHPGTTAFFKLKGAKAVADSCGIVVGSSHCEPLLRNNVDEWDVAKRGSFNYITNRSAVQNYWAERLKEVSMSAGNMFTIGMRGIHDGSMEGVKTMNEKFKAMQTVIDDQQELLRKYVGDPKKQLQVFIPYKEVLQIYERGLKVPDYVTLMWCDDNYGYITRLATPEEQKRIGGGGVYYHLSYWGRPHDYLWLCTTQPGLIYNEMRNAYDHNARKLWIANVHDPKVAGYNLELFLDMAWNIDCVKAETVNEHYKAWLCREFGNAVGQLLYPAMLEFYRLCGQRRPEFMGWNQVELDKKKYLRGLSPAINTEFSISEFGGELDRYLERYASVCRTVKCASSSLRPELKDEYFATIEYPVFSAAAQAVKMLEAQRARMIEKGLAMPATPNDSVAMYASSAKSLRAYLTICALTSYYNDSLANGKWRGLMNMNPRGLPVFSAPSLPVTMSETEIVKWLSKANYEAKTHPLNLDSAIARNACDYDYASSGATKIQMLGHSMQAVALPKGGMLTYNFSTDRDNFSTSKYNFSIDKDREAILRIALIPTQPNDNGDLRFSVSIDGGLPTVFTLKEPFRSEQWKLNVLRGQTLRELKLNLGKGQHTLEIKALDNHLIIDQWMIDFKPKRNFYLIPTE